MPHVPTRAPRSVPVSLKLAVEADKSCELASALGAAPNRRAKRLVTPSPPETIVGLLKPIQLKQRSLASSRLWRLQQRRIPACWSDPGWQVLPQQRLCAHVAYSAETPHLE